jgi:3-deoxy-7-phosphoheptulonate synthase
MVSTENLRIDAFKSIPSPRALKENLPLSAEIEGQIQLSRKEIEALLDGEDNRLLVIVGPCAVHDTEAALDYANRLKTLADSVKEQMLVVMRVYFEKPRTTTGWKGLINDPFLDDTFAVTEGLIKARGLLIKIANLGLPIATEALDPIVPQYIGDLISWTAIGARTTESQTHREMASGLSTPVGFKNGTDGNILIAVQAALSAGKAHRFLGIDPDGRCAVVETKGNRFGHLVLRGSSTPNYDNKSVMQAAELMKQHGIAPNIIIDCSHGNSGKDHTQQGHVFRNVIEQIIEGDPYIKGIMLESNIKAGRQDLTVIKQLEYGLSITDSCISWEETKELLLLGAEKLGPY